jgi:hypothetical protein
MILRRLFALWPNKTAGQMGLLTFQLGGGGLLSLYECAVRFAKLHRFDASGWVLLIGGLLLLTVLATSWRDYSSRHGTS